MDVQETKRDGRLRRALSGLLAPKAEQEIREVQHQVRASGATAINTCAGGARTTVCGVLKTVSLRPRAGVPAVEADLFDGTGHLTIVFLGRRSIGGIEPGRKIIATGRINCPDGVKMMFNPRYELLAMPDGESVRG